MHGYQAKTKENEMGDTHKSDKKTTFLLVRLYFPPVFADRSEGVTMLMVS